MRSPRKTQRLRRFICLGMALLHEEEKGKSRHRTRPFVKKVWKREWLYDHDEKGAFWNLVQKLRLTDSNGFANYFRMDVDSFNDLLEKVHPLTGP